ncbi:ornithine cyclodeaminase family protein [Rhizorhabdus dicambivorans]|uniref:Ornithine cyclodeaminase n=1 Tax=Rhizorhabdus dicambivorans TaxID=1850238 RepID=A0A2A4FX07_9SPHN|nr:ornithine cyclodeaminase family protein [Rhizorhabdus dicambivorans]ATE63611.1 ornithine cyclodeaminase [Rhizorhabdus dicambivorans]PCE42738.1 ornithine cyclodeaminase [Rhizorhabdus dicambivorans]
MIGRIFRAEEVAHWLTYEDCIDAIRTAMSAFSQSGEAQPLREIMSIGNGILFASMPGREAATGHFGAKLGTVIRQGSREGRSRHRGLVVLFDGGTGDVKAIADAEAVTAIRTACASAVATEALARENARTLGLFGCGTQAHTHVHAIAHVRRLERVFVWGRDHGRAADFAERVGREAKLDIAAVEDPREAAAADIVCTVSGASEPVLRGDWLRAGAHVNIVGSSYDGPREVDDALVARGKLFVDSRRAVEVAGAEYRSALTSGAISSDHIRGEVGEVLAGRIRGRTDPSEITLYKSLGLIVQDLAAVDRLDINARAMQEAQAAAS